MARISFIVNTTGLTGGIRVIFEYANRLQERGHKVTIIHVYNLSNRGLPFKEGWVTLGKKLKYRRNPAVQWFHLKVPVIRVPRVTNKFIPDADIVIATANETADWVVKLAPSKGEKFYFIQHFEDWTRDPELVRATWKLPLKKIVIASWMVEFAKNLGEKVEACITNGINLEEFYCTGKDNYRPVRVLMMTHHLPWKGTADGLKALHALKNKKLPFQVTLFGAYPFTDKLPEGWHFIGNPGKELRKVYCEHDIFISPSWQEGCQLPPMEAMACGCAVVATNVGGIPDYSIAGKTALVIEPRQPKALAESIKKLIEDPQLLAGISKAGYEHIQQFTWEHAADQLEKVIVDYA